MMVDFVLKFVNGAVKDSIFGIERLFIHIGYGGDIVMSCLN